MKIKYFLIAILLWSCNNNDPVLNDFEIEVDAQYFINEQTDAWVFFHDSEGKLVDQASFTNAQVLKVPKLESPNDQISVTIVRVLKNLNGDPSFHVESFLNVSFPARWKLSKPASELMCAIVRGELDLRLEGEDLGNIYDVSASDLRYSYLPNSGLSSASMYRFLPLSVADNCAPSFFLYALDKNGNPKYKFLENAQPGIFTYSIDGFTDFDKIVEATLPQNGNAFLLVKAFDAGKSVHSEGFYVNSAFGSYFNEIPISSYKVGYLDRFPKYKTSISARYYKYLVYNYSLYYEEAGSAPSSISLANDFNPEITNASFNQYSYTVNKPIVFKKVTFDYYPNQPTTESGIEWIVFSGDGLVKNPVEMPQSFIEKYPSVFIHKLNLRSSLFYTKYNTFEEEIGIKFEGALNKETFVHFGKELYPLF